jgi:hypothetical protein
MFTFQTTIRKQIEIRIVKKTYFGEEKAILSKKPAIIGETHTALAKSAKAGFTTDSHKFKKIKAR